MSAELDIILKRKFARYSNAELIARANSKPDFCWDDEGYELNRRKQASNGKFEYKMEYNGLVIVKDEK